MKLPLREGLTKSQIKTLQDSVRPSSPPPAPKIRCLHNKNTHAEVRVDYLQDSGRFMCDMKVKCLDCGQPFRFLGLPLGLNLNGATMDVDGVTARLAIAPADRTLHPLEGLQGFGIKTS